MHAVTTHAQVNLSMSLVGVVAMAAFQALYTWPRREALVLAPMRRAGMGAWDVLALLGGFGGESAALCVVLGGRPAAAAS